MACASPTWAGRCATPLWANTEPSSARQLCVLSVPLREEPVEEPTTERLISALREQGCPICRAVRDAEHDVLPGLGRRHRAECHRVCNLHGWHLVESARAETVLTFLDQVAREAIGRMEAWPPTPRHQDRRFPLNLLGSMRNEHARAMRSPDDQRCPVGVWNAHVEVGWARALAEKAASPEVQEPWGREAISPRRAIALMVGPDGLQGVGGVWWPDRGGRRGQTWWRMLPSCVFG